MKVKFYLSIGYQDAIQEDVVELEDGSTDEQIEEEYQEWKNDLIDGYWKKEKTAKEELGECCATCKFGYHWWCACRKSELYRQETGYETCCDEYEEDDVVEEEEE